MQQEEEEEVEKVDQMGAGIREEEISASGMDEPVRIEEEKATMLENEGVYDGAMIKRHADVKVGEFPCSNGSTIQTNHVEESTAELVATNHQATNGEGKRSARARRSNSLYKGFVMG